MSWRRSAIKEVKDWTPKCYICIISCLFTTYHTNCNWSNPELWITHPVAFIEAIRTFFCWWVIDLAKGFINFSAIKWKSFGSAFANKWTSLHANSLISAKLSPMHVPMICIKSSKWSFISWEDSGPESSRILFKILSKTSRTSSDGSMASSSGCKSLISI